MLRRLWRRSRKAWSLTIISIRDWPEDSRKRGLNEAFLTGCSIPILATHFIGQIRDIISQYVAVVTETSDPSLHMSCRRCNGTLAKS